MEFLFLVQVFSAWILCSALKLMPTTSDDKMGFLTTEMTPSTTPMDSNMMKAEMKEPMMDSKMTTPIMMNSKMNSKMATPMMDSKMNSKMATPMMESKMNSKMTTSPMMDSKMATPMVDSSMMPESDSKVESKMSAPLMDSNMKVPVMKDSKMMSPMMDSKMTMEKPSTEVEIVDVEKVLKHQATSEKMVMAECPSLTPLSAAKMHCKKKFEMSKLVQEAVEDVTEVFMNTTCKLNATMMEQLTMQPCLYYCILEQLGLLKHTLPDEKLVQHWLRNHTHNHYTPSVCFRANASLRPNITQAQKRSARLANSCHNQMLTDLPMNIKGKLLMAKNGTDQMGADMGRDKMTMSMKEKITAGMGAMDSTMKNKMPSTNMKQDNPMTTQEKMSMDSMAAKMPMDGKAEKMPMNGMTEKMTMMDGKAEKITMAGGMGAGKMPMDGKTDKMPMDSMAGKLTMSVTTDARMTKDKMRSSSLQAINMLCEYAEALVMCLEKQDEKCMIFTMD